MLAKLFPNHTELQVPTYDKVNSSEATFVFDIAYRGNIDADGGEEHNIPPVVEISDLGTEPIEECHE